MDRLLQAAVSSLSMEAVTAAPPSRAYLKKERLDLKEQPAETQTVLAETRQSLLAEVRF